MSVFADSSALVKLYSDEPGNPAVRALDMMIVSHLARVEVPAALWRKQRMGELSETAARLLTEDFEADYFGEDTGTARFVVVASTAEVLDAAARMCVVHGLRAYDSVQLATAVTARAADPGIRTIAVFDGPLRRAAAREAFELIPE